MRTNSLNIENYTNLFEDAYKQYLGDGEPVSLYKAISDLLGRGGKRLRPSLCLMACDLVGGDINNAVPTAVCIELFHNFSLVHDDIEDNSKLRRGEPTLHIKYGLPIILTYKSISILLMIPSLAGKINSFVLTIPQNGVLTPCSISSCVAFSSRT